MLSFNPTQYDRFRRSIAAIAADGWIGRALTDDIPEFGKANKAQFDKVSRTTAYSPGYLGKLKPSGLRRAGLSGDLGYSKDTLALYSDLLFSWTVDGTSLKNYSDLPYAGQQEDLLGKKARKGQSEESSFYAEDDMYFDLLEEAAAIAIKELWEN